MGDTYKKNTGFADAEGVKFQLDLVIVSFLNGLLHHKNWKISSENAEAGKFDDIVMELPDTTAILVQAKHKKDEKNNITKAQLLSIAKNADFGLPKYFFSYEKDITINSEEKTIVICTNADMDQQGLNNILKHHFVDSDCMLHYKSDRCTFFTFNKNILPELKKSTNDYFEKHLKNSGIDKAVIDDKNIEDFLNNLQIFSSYPSEGNLQEIIVKLLSRLSDFNLHCETYYHRIYRIVEDWLNQPKGEYLTSVRVKAMLCEIKSNEYCELLKDYKISFEGNDTIFNDPNRIFHITVEDGHLMQTLKIFCALQGNNSKKLYVNPNDNIEVQKEIIHAFELNRYKFLIIIGMKIQDDAALREINAKLKAILQKHLFKIVILLADNNNKLAQQIKLKNISKIDGSVTFKDLSRVSQERLLKNNNVVFQGVTITLKELLETQTTNDYTKSMQPKMLEMLVRGEIVKVGEQLLDLDEDTVRYYVRRTFEREFDEFGRTENGISEENIINVNDRMILMSDSAGMGKSTVLAKIAIYVKEKWPHMWVIRINLNDYTTILRDAVRKKRETISVNELLNSREATKLKNIFEEFVFIMEEKVVILFDGVDEIGPDYTGLILRLLIECQGAANFAKIFITSRPHVTPELRAVLSVGLFKMFPFRRQNQIDFLTNYWVHNLQLENITKEKRKCEQYAETLITKMSSWTQSQAYGTIPLHVRMIAEIFQERMMSKETMDWDGCKEYLEGNEAEPKLPGKFNIAKLYDIFIEKKRDVFIDKGNPSGNPTANYALVAQFEECLVYHGSLALDVILNKEESDVFSQRHEGHKDVEQSMLKIGIVQKSGVEFQFIHRTFAEYFVAENIVRELQNHKSNFEFQVFLIDGVLLRQGFKVIRSFLDSLLQKAIDFSPSNVFAEYQSFACKSNCKLIFDLAEEGCIAILQLILNSINFEIITGKKVNIRDLKIKMKDGKSNTLNNLQVLLQEAGVNIMDEYERTPLHSAIRACHLKMVKFLIEQGADVNIRDERGRTILYFAAEKSKLAIVKYLVKQGADILVRDSQGCTALHGAAEGSKIDTIKYLLQHGVDINARDANRRTALYSAVEKGSANTVNCLVQRGANLDVGDNRGRTALHLACKRGKLNMAKCLVDHGADLNARDNRGGTPLHGAAKRGELDAVKYLLERHVDINSKDDSHRTGLHLAACWSDLNTVKYLVEHGADLNIRDNKGYTPLHAAAKRGELDSVKYLVEREVDINAKNDDHRTALHLAARRANGRLDTLKYLLEEGADINVRDNKGSTPLHRAAGKGELDAVKYLAERQVDINVKDDDHHTALHLAAYRGKLDTVRYLVERGADTKARNNKGYMPLHVTAERGKLDIVQYLVNHEVDINVKDNDHRTALHLAARRNKLNTVKYLVESSADLNIRDNKGCTALHCAAKKDALDTVKYLLEHYVDINVKDDDHHTALYLAARWSKVNTVKYLGEHGADFSIKDKKGRTPLHGAAESGDRSIIEYLVESDINVNSKDDDNRTALHLSTRRGKLDAIKYLVEHGSDINVKDNKGCTPLHDAAERGDLDTIKYLVEGHTNINLTNNDNRTALHLAARSSKLDIVKYLVKHGSDFNVKDNKGCTPLHDAAERCDVDIIKYLVEHHADINVKDDDHRTALHLAAHWSKLDTLKYLVEHGADPNIKDSLSCTPLHEAAERGELDSVKYLVERGAELNVRDSNYRTALHLAAKRNKLDIVEYLEKHGADPDIGDDVRNNTL